MKMNKMFTKWILPALIILLAFTVLPPLFSSWFAPSLAVLGSATGYVLSFCVSLVALWAIRYTEKNVTA